MRHEEVVPLKTINIKAKEIGVYALLGDQVKNDLNVSLKDYEDIYGRPLQKGVLHIRTLLYQTERREQETEVPFENHVFTKMPAHLIIAILAGNIPITVISTLYEPWLLILSLFAIVMPLALFKGGWIQRVKGTARVKKVQWETFPDNDRVFPEYMGKPRVHQLVYADIKEIEGD